MMKYLLGWLIVLAVRLLPFRPANVEPLMATLMPYSKRYGWLGAFVFAFFGMVLYDVVTGKVGQWTWVTGIVYGLIGVGAHFFFKNRTGTVKQYVGYAVVGTLVFDAITGLGIGPVFFHQSFLAAAVGQIPFTMYHLLGNIAFAALASPAIARWIVANEALETPVLLRRLRAAFVIH